MMALTLGTLVRTQGTQTGTHLWFEDRFEDKPSRFAHQFALITG